MLLLRLLHKFCLFGSAFRRVKLNICIIFIWTHLLRSVFSIADHQLNLHLMLHHQFIFLIVYGQWRCINFWIRIARLGMRRKIKRKKRQTFSNLLLFIWSLFILLGICRFMQFDVGSVCAFCLFLLFQKLMLSVRLIPFSLRQFSSFYSSLFVRWLAGWFIYLLLVMLMMLAMLASPSTKHLLSVIWYVCNGWNG